VQTNLTKTARLVQSFVYLFLQIVFNSRNLTQLKLRSTSIIMFLSANVQKRVPGRRLSELLRSLIYLAKVKKTRRNNEIIKRKTMY